MEDQEEIVVPEQEPMKHQIAKLVLGTLAGFLATKAVGAIYDTIRERASQEPEDDLEIIEVV